MIVEFETRHLSEEINNQKMLRIAQFRYFKIHLETKDITTRLRGTNNINL